MGNKDCRGDLRSPPKRVEPSGSRSLASRCEFSSLRVLDRPLKTVKAFVSRRTLLRNTAILKGLCGPSVKLCGVVKADAYGHDARSVVSVLNDGQVDAFAVSNIEEAQRIDPFTGHKPILITSPFFDGMDAEWIELARIRGFHCTVCSLSGLRHVSGCLKSGPAKLNIHLKIDTGMGRCGATCEEAMTLLRFIQEDDKLNLAGVYTHFADADDRDLSYARQQLARFNEFLVASSVDQLESVVKHASNTAATIKLPEAHLDMVRCGLGLYGYVSNDYSAKFDLRPVMKVQAPLIQVKSLAKGQSCGYGRSFIAPHDMRIGVIPMGYSDGLLRCLSNRAYLRIGKQPVPIIGKISMDLTLIDISRCLGADEGDAVTIIDDDPDSPCSAQALASLAETIPYEIFSLIGSRVKRVLID